jgi:hypothetical protein
MPRKTMTMWTTVDHMGRRSRRIPVSLPFVPQISDEPHYHRPQSAWRQAHERATGPEVQHVAAAVDPRRDGAKPL